MIDEANLAKQLIESTPRSVADTANDVWGLILGDKIAFYRRRNAMKLSKLLHEEAERLGGRLDPSRIPDQFAFEWTEAATKKTDESVQRMFAKLLASAATENGVSDERLIYVLREMSGEDAILFSTLYAEDWFRQSIDGVVADHARIQAKELGIDADMALDSLLRIGLLREATDVFDGNKGHRWTFLGGNDPEPREVEIRTRRLVRPSTIGLRLYDQISGASYEETLE